ncbi:MAG TPA: hypothetical protein VIK78_19825 [Ruminiclostridium sp.]
MSDYKILHLTKEEDLKQNIALLKERCILYKYEIERFENRIIKLTDKLNNIKDGD